LKGRLFFYETSNNPCLRDRPQGQTAAQEYDRDDDSGSDSDDGDEMSGVKAEERQ
jgi:hypothetical protein